MLDQQTKQQLKDGYQKIKPQLKQQFPDLAESDIQQLQSDPDSFVKAAARKSGRDEITVEQQVKQLAGIGSR
jgi:hypothetical protein